MRSFFYSKIAVTNITKNKKLYLPYIISFIGILAMFYNVCYIASAREIGEISDSAALRTMLFLGMWIIGFFSVIFLFYTNSFMLKRRKKEFGVFNILGMEKRHIGRVMLLETFYITVICIGVGLLVGILLSKLMLLLLFQIIDFDVVFGFEITPFAVVASVLLFLGISFLNLLNNVAHVHLSKPIELLRGSNVGEKEPKTNWVLAVIGVIALGGAYYLANFSDMALMAFAIFFPAVLLTIIGTYCLFISGSIAVLKILRKKKSYYYKPNHFTAISGLIYRMKQNAAGLASICILSTAVIFVLCTTVSMYVGIDDIMKTRFPKNFETITTVTQAKDIQTTDSIIAEQTRAYGVTPLDAKSYWYYQELFIKTNGVFEFAGENSPYSSENGFAFMFFTLEEYNKLNNTNAKLQDGEALISLHKGEILQPTLNINGTNLIIKERLNYPQQNGSMYSVSINQADIIVKDEQAIEAILANTKVVSSNKYYYTGFNLEDDAKTQYALTQGVIDSIRNNELYASADSREYSRGNFTNMYGGLMFIGLYLGFLFLMATVLIIYYKQVSEGYEDKARFAIMQKVGMSKQEVKTTIKSQVLTVFFLPIAVMAVHIVAVFKLMTQMLSMLNLTNLQLFGVCAGVIILIFLVFYWAVYKATARVYYNIVSLEE